MRSLLFAALVASGCALNCDMTYKQGSTACDAGTVWASNAWLNACRNIICPVIADNSRARGEILEISKSDGSCLIKELEDGTGDAICVDPANNNPSSGGGDDGGLTGGGVFLIIFFVGFAVYFAAGSVYMWKVKGETGSNIIPNSEFWKGLPGLMKDGAVFIKNKVTGGGQYESV